MSKLNRTGLDARFILFAIYSTLGSIILFTALFPLIGGVASGEFSGILPIFMLFLWFVAYPAISALPVSLPFSLIAWVICNLLLFGRFSDANRIRISAVTAGLAGTAGFLVVAGYGSTSSYNSTPWVLVFLLSLCVTAAAVVAAEIAYRPSSRRHEE